MTREQREDIAPWAIFFGGLGFYVAGMLTVLATL